MRGEALFMTLATILQPLRVAEASWEEPQNHGSLYRRLGSVFSSNEMMYRMRTHNEPASNDLTIIKVHGSGQPEPGPDTSRDRSKPWQSDWPNSPFLASSGDSNRTYEFSPTEFHQTL